MNQGTETLVALNFLESKLSGLAWSTGYFADGQVPQNQNYPYVVSAYSTSSDVAGIGPNSRIMSNTFWLVFVESQGTWEAMKPWARALDAALEGMTMNLSDGTVLACTRENPYHNVEDFEGSLVRSLGGQYRIYVQNN